MTSGALVRAMVEVERVWLEGLVAAGIAPLGMGEIEDAGELAPEVAAGSEAAVIPSFRYSNCSAQGLPRTPPSGCTEA